jgi:hypothetical protein
MEQLKQDSQSMTARVGQPGEVRTARSGQQEQDSQNRSKRTGAPEEYSQNRTNRKGLSQQVR